MPVRYLVFSIVFAMGIGSAAAQSKPPAPELPDVPNFSELQKQGYTLKISPYSFANPMKLGPPEQSSCYTIRAYQFARNDASADSMMMKKETTCQSTALFQMKDAQEFQQIAPH